MSTAKGWFAETNNEELLALARLPQLHPIDYHKLRQKFSSFTELGRAKVGDILETGLTPAQAEAIFNREKNVNEELGILQREQIKIITIDDSHYPNRLKELPDPPLWLFYRGDLSVTELETVSVVGTRKPSSYAKTVTDLLLPESLITQLVTVSGLAYGVDELVHLASLKAARPTIAVMAGGLDKIYPADHTQLAARIIDTGGLLLSEYPPLVRPQPYRFPIRNRIVAGLSPLTIIIEAKIQSGTLTTARAALDYNRDLFAVPGRVTDDFAEGTNFLIKSGAVLCDSVNQIAEYYGINLQQKQIPLLDTDEGQILHLITDAPADMDELVVKTGLPVEKLLGLVTRLELSGQVYQDSAGRYSAKKHG